MICTQSPTNSTMAASSSENVVPDFATQEAPVHYFTLLEEDYTEVGRWMVHYKFEYGRFFASFINYCEYRLVSNVAFAIAPP